MRSRTLFALFAALGVALLLAVTLGGGSRAELEAPSAEAAAGRERGPAAQVSVPDVADPSSVERSRLAATAVAEAPSPAGTSTGLESVWTIQGVVRNGQQWPVPNLLVSTSRGRGRTDANGRFRFESRPCDELLRIESDEWVLSGNQRIGPFTRRTDLVLTVELAARVTVRLPDSELDDSGAWSLRWTCDLIAAGGMHDPILLGGAWSDVRFDLTGTCELDLPSGDFARLHAIHDDGRGWQHDFIVRDGLDLEVAPEPTVVAHVEGVVRGLDGLALGGVRVWLGDREVWTDRDGRFVLAGPVHALSGNSLQAELPGSGLRASLSWFSLEFSGWPNARGLELTLQLPPRLIDGRLLDASGTPLASWTVRVHGEDRDRWGSAVTDADGRFELRGRSETLTLDLECSSKSLPEPVLAERVPIDGGTLTVRLPLGGTSD